MSINFFSHLWQRTNLFFFKEIYYFSQFSLWTFQMCQIDTSISLLFKLTNVNMTHTRTKITKHNCNQLRERISWLNCCVTEFSGLAFDLIIWLQQQLQLFWLCTTKIWYFFRIVDTNTLRGCLGLNALDQTIYNVL